MRQMFEAYEAVTRAATNVAILRASVPVAWRAQFDQVQADLAAAVERLGDVELGTFGGDLAE